MWQQFRKKNLRLEKYEKNVEIIQVWDNKCDKKSRQFLRLYKYEITNVTKV